MVADQTFNTPAGLSAGENSRREQAKRLFAFAEKQIQRPKDETFLAGTPLDWDDPNGSLLAHPGVQHCIRVVASVAALEAFFRADKFLYLFPDAYISELEAEISTTNDPDRKEALNREIQYCRNANLDAELRTLAQHHAKMHASNLAHCLKVAFAFCRRVLGDWLEIIPAQAVRELDAKLERLDAMPIPERLKFFGLADLILEEH